MTDPFAQAGADDLAALLAQAPLCWIVPHADPAAAILMPVVLESDAYGAARSLLGHLPKRAPVTAALSAAGEASFLFLGPNRYISPAMVGRSDWAPTWNFASARLTGRVVLDEALTRPAVEAMTMRMEGEHGWSVADLGARVETLLARVIGFRATIDHSAPRMKLGQDEVAADRAAIEDALGDDPLVDWMRRHH